jgi:hypothetical protein
MELGLVRMVHAGRLRAIEDVIAQIGGGAAPGGTARVATPTASTPLASPAAAARPAAEPPGGDTLAVNASLKAKIHALLVQAGNKFSADAIENAAVIETAGAVQITASQTDIFSLKTDKALPKIVEQSLGRPVKINFAAGEPGAASQEDLPQKKKALGDSISEEAEQRARQNPEVRRYQELFPGSQIRAVRDLSDL